MWLLACDIEHSGTRASCRSSAHAPLSRHRARLEECPSWARDAMRPSWELRKGRWLRGEKGGHRVRLVRTSIEGPPRVRRGRTACHQKCLERREKAGLPCSRLTRYGLSDSPIHVKCKGLGPSALMLPERLPFTPSPASCSHSRAAAAPSAARPRSGNTPPQPAYRCGRSPRTPPFRRPAARR